MFTTGAAPVDTFGMSLTPPPFAARSAWDPPPPTRHTPAPAAPTPARAAEIRASSPYDTIPGTVLLSGITGDTAYGFPTDYLERIAVYATPARALTGLNPPTDTTTANSPEPVLAYEAATYLRLVLAGSPDLLELLWLDGITTASGAPLWEVVEPVAMRLIELRHQLVSAPTVRESYFTAARSRLIRLSQLPPSTSTTTQARDVARLLRHGFTLYTTGVLPVRVDDPGWYDDFAAHPDRWLAWFEDEARGWERARSALVSRPNTAAAQEWLAEVRATFP